MDQFSLSMSSAEVCAAPQPSEFELGIMAKALGTIIHIGVPVLPVIEEIARITPNLRLRWALVSAAFSIRENNEISLAVRKENLDPKLVEVFRTGETQGSIDIALLDYAKSLGIQPGQVAKSIGRDEQVQRFTTRVAELCKGGESVEKALDVTIDEFQDPVRHIARSLRLSVDTQQGFRISVLSCSSHLDSFYRSVLLASAQGGCLERGFEVLAEC